MGMVTFCFLRGGGKAPRDDFWLLRDLLTYGKMKGSLTITSLGTGVWLPMVSVLGFWNDPQETLPLSCTAPASIGV